MYQPTNRKAKKMKSAFLLLLIAALGLPAGAQSLHLTAGESFTYSFDSMLVAGPTLQPTVMAAFQVHFVNDLFGPGDLIRLEMFEDSPAGGRVVGRNITGTSPERITETSLLFSRPETPIFWEDLQGAVRLTVLSGSVDLDRVGFTTEYRGTLYGNAVPVPEPAMWGLLSIGGLVILLFKRRGATLEPGRRFHASPHPPDEIGTAATALRLGNSFHADPR